MEYSKQGHCVYYTRYHIVMTTKYRRKVLKAGMREYLLTRIHEISRHYPEIRLHEANTDEDHIHLLVSIPPRISVSHCVNIMKSNTGRMMRKKFPFLDEVYWGEDGIWSAGYFVSTVGVNEETIERYIASQGEEDKGQAKLEL